MYVWNLKFVGATCFSSIMGDPLSSLMVQREMGVFTPDSTQPDGMTEGWEVGELVAQTKEGKRKLRAKVICRKGGQKYWFGAGPGTRWDDYRSWEGYSVKIEAEKSANNSWFATQLKECGWVLQSEQEVEGEVNSYDLHLQACMARDADIAVKSDAHFATKDAAKTKA